MATMKYLLNVVYSENDMKHLNVQLLIVVASGIYSYHWALKF
jgi:hypothetical protein